MKPEFGDRDVRRVQAAQERAVVAKAGDGDRESVPVEPADELRHLMLGAAGLKGVQDDGNRYRTAQHRLQRSNTGAGPRLCRRMPRAERKSRG